MKPIILVAAAAGAVLAPATVRAQEPFPGLDAYIAKAVEQWKVPGLSVAIVRNDSVIYTKGFGVLAAGTKTPVDAQTLFEIGSSSKAFTATLVSMLVADGKMKFDDRLTTYLPDFRMYDPIANADVTVRDALTHRSGIARGEFVWLGSGFNRDEVLHHVRFLKPEAPFRSHYSYQNMMFLAAGQAAGKAGGSTWDELVKTRIFQPVGMTSTISDYHSAGPNSAKPHGQVKDSVFVQPFMNGANIGPAGSILSNAHDMARWLRFQLAGGVIDGKRLVAAAPFRETHTPQILMTGAPEAGMRAGGDSVPVTHFSAYGMGWIIEDYRNHLMWQHGGNTIGSTAAVGMLPEDKFGVAVLSSMGSAQLPGLIMHYIFDRQIGAPMKDLAGEAFARQIAQRRRADSAQVAQAGAAKAAGVPPVPLASFVGTFADSLYGEATVTMQGDHLVMHRGEWTGPLEYQNTLNFSWNLLGQSPLPALPIKFEVGADGKITGLYFGIGGDVTLLARKAPPGGRGGRGGNP